MMVTGNQTQRARFRKRYTRWMWGSFVMAVVFFVTGCMYPEEERQQPTTDVSTFVRAVQDSVNSYMNDNTNEPLVSTDNPSSTEIFRSISLRDLYPRYLTELPTNSFEMGGNDLYVLVTVDDKPTVKLVDLRFKEQLDETQLAYDRYMRNNKEAPRGELLADGIYVLDTTKLNLKNDTIRSMFSSQQLKFLVSADGKVSVDYMPDINEYLRLNPTDRKPGEDLRYVLAKHSLYAPFAANSYFLNNDQLTIASP